MGLFRKIRSVSNLNKAIKLIEKKEYIKAIEIFNELVASLQAPMINLDLDTFDWKAFAMIAKASAGIAIAYFFLGDEGRAIHHWEEHYRLVHQLKEHDRIMGTQTSEQTDILGDLKIDSEREELIYNHFLALFVKHMMDRL
jgi:hypothetical protein